MIFTTSICSNYLPKAIALAESTKKHEPNSKFVLCLVEREAPVELKTMKCFDEIVLAKDMYEPSFNFEAFMFSHSIVEASTAVKGDLFRHMFSKYPAEKKFVYLDPDTFMYAPFVELDLAMDEHDIVLTPHLLYPGNIDMEVSTLKHGVFNLGFLAVTRSEQGKQMIDWWADRLRLFCFEDHERGLFTDQKWINLAPCFFDQTYVMREPGYNYATWTIMTRRFTKVKDEYQVNGKPLRFVHFSGFDGGTFNNCVQKWAANEDEKKVLTELATDYRNATSNSPNGHFSKTPWSYQNYFNGSPIRNEHRMRWRSMRWDYPHRSPFELGSSFFSFALTRNSPRAFAKKVRNRLRSYLG